MVGTDVPLRSSAVSTKYFVQDGYYMKHELEHQLASFWHGGAAQALGLRAHVRPSRFESVLSGYVPGTDLRLGRMREGEHVHRPGWDITLSAPKSVSLEALVMGDRRVIRAHDEAVRATLDFVEAELLQTRGWDPATRRRPRVSANGMVVAGFRHLASRNLDPQLHTHCVLANMTRNTSGEWRSVEPTTILRSQKLIGAFYRNELARRLQALGMAVSPTLVGRVPGFELAGYERSFLDAFSGRRREILEYLEQKELPCTAENTQRAALRTRRRKEDGTLADLLPACRANDVCIVMGHDDGRVVLAHPDGEERRFRPSGNASRYLGLYDTERIELRAGDRIRWTRNRKAPRARGTHSQAPDLVKGGEAEIVEIGHKRVRFRDGERTFSLALGDAMARAAALAQVEEPPSDRHRDHGQRDCARSWQAQAVTPPTVPATVHGESGPSVPMRACGCPALSTIARSRNRSVTTAFGWSWRVAQHPNPQFDREGSMERSPGNRPVTNSDIVLRRAARAEVSPSTTERPACTRCWPWSRYDRADS